MFKNKTTSVIFSVKEVDQRGILLVLHNNYYVNEHGYIGPFSTKDYIESIHIVTPSSKNVTNSRLWDKDDYEEVVNTINDFIYEYNITKGDVEFSIRNEDRLLYSLRITLNQPPVYRCVTHS